MDELRDPLRLQEPEPDPAIPRRTRKPDVPLHEHEKAMALHAADVFVNGGCYVSGLDRHPRPRRLAILRYALWLAEKVVE